MLSKFNTKEFSFETLLKKPCGITDYHYSFSANFTCNPERDKRLNRYQFLLFLLLQLISIPHGLVAQTKSDSSKISVAQKALQEGLNLISRNPNDSVKNERNEDRFQEYSGRIIRNIYIESAGFEVSIYGTEKKIIQRVGNLANNFHTNTRQKTIRQHLFFKANQELNPYKLGDNERYLRSQDFILESRIIVSPVHGTDSVDISVVTRDVFSLGAQLGGSIPTAPKFQFYDANLAGTGQQFKVDLHYDPDRLPKMGFGLHYLKSSILGSLVDLELSYSQLNKGVSFGDENEYSINLALERPLVSPYSRLAGGFLISHNWSKNSFNKPDSSYLDYRYNVLNAWVGYNFGAKKEIQDRRREFLAIRYFDGTFVKTPYQDHFIRQNRYTSERGFLAEFTVYEKNYFKTRYVYGFGRTEDQPYGYAVAITSGYIRSEDSNRPYTGIKLNYSNIKGRGGFYEGNLNLGSYFQNRKPEDALLQANWRYFSPAYSLGRFKLRTGFMLGYSRIFNRKFSDWMEISSNYIPGLKVISLAAKKRNHAEVETRLYTPWAPLGFRLAPFASAQVAALYCTTCEERANRYYGFSAGLRTRNENLIFGTIDLKFTLIPRDELGESKFSIRLRQNLRIRDDNNFVKAPSIIQYNY